MFTKSLTVTEMNEAGEGLARIAILSAIDSDGDTYARGAFAGDDGGQWCAIIPAHDRRAMPLGKAWLYEADDQALAKLHVNLETQAGRDWHQALKFDLATGKPVQEWSYGFEVLDAAFEDRGGKRIRVLKKLKVDEVSPVLRGAGIGTGTIAMKGAALKADRFAGLIGSLGDLAGAVAGDASALSASGRKQLSDIHDALGAALAVKQAEATCEHCGTKHEDDNLCPIVTEAIGGYVASWARGHVPAA